MKRYVAKQLRKDGEVNSAATVFSSSDREVEKDRPRIYLRAWSRLSQRDRARYRRFAWAIASRRFILHVGTKPPGVESLAWPEDPLG